MLWSGASSLTSQMLHGSFFRQPWGVSSAKQMIQCGKQINILLPGSQEVKVFLIIWEPTRLDYIFPVIFYFPIKKSRKTRTMNTCKLFPYIHQFCYVYFISFYRCTLFPIRKEVADIIPKYFSLYLPRRVFSHLTPM